MFAHIALATRNVAATSRFFSATLGWRQIREAQNIEMTAAWMESAPGQQVHLIQVDDFQVSPFEHEFGRHFAFFHSRAEFPALKERLVAHGATLVDPLRTTPFERFFFRDPNGYLFEIVDRDGFIAE